VFCRSLSFCHVLFDILVSVFLSFLYLYLKQSHRILHTIKSWIWKELYHLIFLNVFRKNINTLLKEFGHLRTNDEWSDWQLDFGSQKCLRRLVVFSTYSSFSQIWNWPLGSSWNSVESGVKDHNPIKIKKKICMCSERFVHTAY
jgi:hypothetical protein